MEKLDWKNTSAWKLRKLVNLIDWSTWQKKETLLKSRVEIFCECGVSKNETIDALYRVALKKNKWKCMGCAVKEGMNNEETRDKIRESNKRR